MKTYRLLLLALSVSLIAGCSDQATDPADPTSTTTVLLSGSEIQKLQQQTQPDITSIQNAISSLPDNAIRGQGIRTAMLARLNNVMASVARGDVAQAIHHLQILRGWVDGCGSATDKPKPNDQVRDCGKQVAIRALIDGLIDTLNDKLDTTPTVTINQAAAQADPTSASPITYTVVFSEPVTGFDGTDVVFTGSTATGTLAAAVTGSGENYTVSVSGMTGTGTVVAAIAASAAVDADNNPTAASTSTDNTVTYQSPPATVTINQAVGQSDPTTAGPITFTVVFSKPVTGFTGSDVSFTGSTAGGTLAAAVSGSGATYTVSVTGMTSNGTVVATIPANAAVDAGNQGNTASTSTDNSVTLQAGSPTVTVNQAAGQVDPSSAATITFTVQFSAPVTGFTASDVAFTGSTATGTLVAAVTGSGATYTVQVTGMTGSGTVVVTIPAGAATDSGALPTAASTSTDNTVTWVKP